MHIISIDVGAYKTRMFSSKSGGTIVTDELGNIDFSTILTLTKPRKYGAGVNIELAMDTNESKKGFFQDINDFNNQKCLYMYFEYLLSCIQRNGPYKYAVLTIPEYFGIIEKTILHDICERSNLKIIRFMYQLTSTAACMAFRRKDIEKFMILDFGFQKCSVGVFEMKDGELFPLYQNVLRMGAREYDNVLLSMIIEKYKFIDNIVTRERLQPLVYKFKKGFRDLEKVSERVLNDNYEYVNIEINREDFMKRTSELTDKIKEFIEGVYEEIDKKFTIPKIVEVVGNNLYFCVIEKIMEKHNYSTTMNASNSIVEGACFACSVNDITSNKYKVHDIIGSNINFRVEKEKNG